MRDQSEQKNFKRLQQIKNTINAITIRLGL